MVFVKQLITRCSVLLLSMLFSFIAQADSNRSGSGVEVKQQSFIWPGQQNTLSQFLASQQQLEGFSLLLIPTAAFNGDSRKIVAELKKAGITESQLQLRYDLKAKKKSKNSEDDQLEVRVEWFVARIRQCRSDDFGCANRNNLLHMAQPKDLVIAPQPESSNDGTSALKALETMRENNVLERRSAIGGIKGN